MDDIPNKLLPALRQYRHNDNSGYVFGFELIKTCDLFEELESNQLTWRCAFNDKPDCTHSTGSSGCVLVVRDCGENTLESYAISKYRDKGWGVKMTNHMFGSNIEYKWLDQEINGYRVTKWCYLPPSKTIKTTNP